MDTTTINWLAILVAGISTFVLGGVWYSPALFGKAWMAENNITTEDVKQGNAARIYGWAFCGLDIVFLFEKKSGKLIFINGGYLLAALTLMGAIIGAWR